VADRATGDGPNKRPWVAAVLAVLYPGLGHVYLRKWGRAMVWFGVILTASVYLIPESAIPTELSVEAFLAAGRAAPTDIMLLLTALLFVSVLDAYWLANRANEMARSAVDADGTVQVEDCPHCGKELDEDLAFCPWCSERLAGPADEDGPEDT
jgi:uncharacterized paraquat-inducible protein A